MRNIAEENVRIHPKWTQGRSYYDVALVKLEPPVTLAYAVRPICLPEHPSLDVDEFEGHLVRVAGSDAQTFPPHLSISSCRPVGWGTSAKQYVSGSDVLRDTKLKVYSAR